MKFKDLKVMEPVDLVRLLAKTREELRAARFHVRTGQEKDVRGLRERRTLIARILTLLAPRDGAAKQA